ncbi:MAG: heavy metal translocating P-type ATPase [Alloprevotella sp.]
MIISGALLALCLLADGLTLWPAAWPWLRAAGYVLAFIPVGWPVCREAVEGLFHKEPFSEFTLMTVAAVAAFVLGEWPEAVAVMLFYAGGEYLQERAVGRARRHIGNLAALMPKVVHIVTEEGETTLPPEAVRPGMTVVLRPGERMAVDGVLTGDEGADFDTSALTGESLPRHIRPGETVEAGMIACRHIVRLRVVRAYGESAMARIQTLVEQANARKAPTEVFIRRFARIYTPTVICLAVGLAIVPPLLAIVQSLPPHWDVWTYRATVFLVISCPCALVVSVPLGYFAGIGRASRLGILVKGGDSLDRLSEVETVVFDKTGTLTRGAFEVTGLHAESYTQEQVLALAASAESASHHPLAKAIVHYAGRRHVAISQPQQAEEISGRGVKAVVEGHTVWAGNRRLLAEAAISLPTTTEGDDNEIFVAIDGCFAGRFTLTDALRPEAAEAVGRLRKSGIRHIAMLSGDKRTVVADVANRLELDDFRAELMPADKAAQMERLKASGHRPAFAGDGINDAPALATAHVGIAMGSGSDTAIETADVVVRGDSPLLVAEAVRLGRATKRLALTNIATALGLKAAVMALGAIGFAPLWLAVLADTGVALLCVLTVMWWSRKP